jgi:hypothetical protein
MRLRLTYNGPLRSGGNPRNPMHEKRIATHKHDIRRQFHHQLKHFWATNRFLSETQFEPDAFAKLLPANARRFYKDGTVRRPMALILADSYQHSGYRFVPLVRKEIKLTCSLRVLFLRRDFPAPVLDAGDIDNRLKTLVDALRMPSQAEVSEPPKPDEDPFYVLLDDDRQVTHVELESDAALAPENPGDTDPSFARLVVTVEIHPYDVNMFNMNFA